MEVGALHKPFDEKTAAKRALIQPTDDEPGRKRRLMSADSFCFSLEDLTSRLYNKHEPSTITSDQEETLDELDFCFWCDAKRFENSFKCPYHSNKENSSDGKVKKPYAYQNIPQMLQLYSTNTPLGVRTGLRAIHVIPAGAWIGPFEGTIVQREQATLKNAYMWEIFKDGKLYGFIDGSDENKCSWMRFIRRARHQQEQNLGAFQYQDKIYYRALHTILPGQELLVWYDQQYTRFLGMPGKDATKEKIKQGELPKTTSSPNSSQQETVGRNGIEVFERLKGSIETSSKSSVPNSIQMETSFGKIGTLTQSPTKAKIQTESTSPIKVATDSSPTMPTPSVSNGISLKITNFTRRATSEKPEKDPQSPNIAMVPSPTSPSTPKSIDSGFSFESALAESPTKEDSSGISVWRCGQCHKSFAQRAMLQVHVCCNVPFRPYKCGHCDRSFSTSGEMRSHAVVHQGKKPFKCGYCSRAFSGATTLNNHIRIHTGEKPFKCEKCGKTFSQGSQLSKHEKIPGDCVLDRN